MNKFRAILGSLFAALLIVITSLSVASMQAADISAQPSQVVQANNSGTNQLPLFAPGVVLVSLRQGVTANMVVDAVQVTDPSLNETLTKLGVKDIEPVFSSITSASHALNASSSDLSHIFRLHVSSDADVLKIAQELSAHPTVKYAEPDYLAHIITTPNDPEYSSQWGLSTIDAPAAWDVVTGTVDVVVAVIDAGIDKLILI